MTDLANIPNDRLLVDFTAQVESDLANDRLGMSPTTVAMRDEILRRMDTPTERKTRKGLRRVTRTGDATATGGGFANTGIVRR